MPTVFPFRAFRPPAVLANRVASVPYDVVNREEARALARDNPHSFLHVTKPEIDLPDAVDPHDERVYQRGREALDEMIAAGTLRPDAQPSFYVYRLATAEHAQVGIALCASVADYEKGSVRRHEHTRPDKEEDRVRHLEVTGAHTGTVFLIHPDCAEIDNVVDTTTSRPPEIDIDTGDGVRHQLWAVSHPSPVRTLTAAFANLEALYIADGHHRSAAAARVAARQGGFADRFLAVSFPRHQARILAYNRVVKDLGSLSAAEFLAAVERSFRVAPGAPNEVVPRQFGMFFRDQWYTLRAPADSKREADPVARLDVSILQDGLLQPILGIDDPRRDPRIDFVGGIHGTGMLEARVRSGDGVVAWALPATSIDDMLAVASAGRVMPPKSTWFEPKLRDGLVVHKFG